MAERGRKVVTVRRGGKELRPYPSYFYEQKENLELTPGLDVG